jgi:eukaryotic-like serine/threonine-protein kinase
MSFHVGEIFGDYEILAIIGAGSMGQVYQVEHRITKRKEAVKVLSTELANDTQVHRFEREIAIQAQLHHPNIATAHNALRWKGRLILVMEFLEGQTLETILKRGRLPLESGIQYIRQTLLALQYAHQQGVVHRDVNPANLIITPNGTVKLTDFGVSQSFEDSQLTNWGEIVGAMAYMAPEQARASVNPDRRSDLYSVGAILYQILTGRKPFGDHRSLSALLTESEDRPPRPTDIEMRLRPEWNDIVRTSMDNNRARRFQSADEFLNALDGIDRTSFFGASSSNGATPPWRLSKSAVSIATLALALAVAAALTMGRFHTTAPRPAAIRGTSAKLVPRPPLISDLKSEPARPTAEPPLRVRAVPRHRLTEAAPSHSEASIEPHELAPQAPGGAEASRSVEPITESKDAPIIQPIPEEQSLSPVKKGRFWRKLNPFRKKKGAAPVDLSSRVAGP